MTNVALRFSGPRTRPGLPRQGAARFAGQRAVRGHRLRSFVAGVAGVATLVLAVPATVAAQSSLAGRGLGLPASPMDARSIGWGGVSIGLPSGSLAMTDPAAAADLTVPAITFSFQSSWASAVNGALTDDFSGTRFPVVAVSYPSRLGVFFIHAGGLLDQRSTSSLTQEIGLEGTDTRARVTDEFSSDGGVSSVRFGVTRNVGPALSLAVFGGRNLGSTRRSFRRTFDSLDIETDLPPFSSVGEWKYRGWTGGAGVGVRFSTIARVAASWTWSGTVDAIPTEDTEGDGRSYSFPSELRLGGSALLAPGLAVAASFERTGWSTVDGDLISARASDAIRWGAGLEWQALSVFGKPSSLRFGYRGGDLPFHSADEATASEGALTAGLGIDLLSSREVNLARLDFGLERGNRQLGSLTEDFFRLSTTIRVSGF